MQIPYIKQLYSDFSRKKLDVLGVSVDHSLKAMKIGIIEHEMGWIHIYDENRQIVSDFGVSAYPTLILIDKMGKVLWRGVGFSEDKFDKVREIVNSK